MILWLLCNWWWWLVPTVIIGVAAIIYEPQDAKMWTYREPSEIKMMRKATAVICLLLLATALIGILIGD
jgi:accessory gene regulator protein AgrB